MSAKISLVEEEAIAWFIRVRDPDFSDWDIFTEWLNAHPTHNPAFQKIALLDGQLPQLMATKPMPTSHRLTLWRWSAAQISAVAAALIAVVTFSFFLNQPTQYSVVTRPGEQRLISLGDGSIIKLNGGSQLTLSKHKPRFAVLNYGEALFTVKHNESAPFIVEVGNSVVQDAGTIFNIVSSGADTEVVVAEGAIIFNPAKDKMVLKAGSGLRVSKSGAVEIFEISRDAVGRWPGGQLVYRDTSIDRIAADISRTTGARLSVDRDARSVRFTGTINITKNIDKFLAETAPVLGVEIKLHHEGWVLAKKNEDTR